MINLISILTGKTVHKLASLRGGGSALPGKMMEKISLKPLADDLKRMPYGVIVVSGTNGKTSTTKALVELLTGQGLKVFTNKSGSNFVRGVASSWVKIASLSGKSGADIAVLELDEAHAIHFIKQFDISYALLLNVMRDQLDRFGELDQVADLLNQVADAAKQKVIINGIDSRLTKCMIDKQDKAIYYNASGKAKTDLINIDNEGETVIENALFTLTHSDETSFSFLLSDKVYDVSSKLSGVYNHYNIIAALTACKTILGDKFNMDNAISSIQMIEPAFGRAETIVINGTPVTLLLVKNPSGFQSSLTLVNDASDVLIAINDDYADGRDVSWLWDVDFSALNCANALLTTGTRSEDMRLRLKYEDLKVVQSDPDLNLMIATLLKAPSKNKRIFSTYTAMLKIRKHLKRLSNDNDSSPLS